MILSFLQTKCFGSCQGAQVSVEGVGFRRFRAVARASLPGCNMKRLRPSREPKELIAYHFRSVAVSAV